MQTKVQSVDPAMSLAELERAFLEEQVTGFPVVDGGRLVGVVTRSDIVRKLATEQSYAEYVSEYHRELGGTADYEPVESAAELTARAAARLGSATVKDVMSHSPVTVSPDTPVDDIARLLVGKRFHRVFVTAGDKLEGIITSLDLVQLLADDGSASS
jgi:CBS domain-containing protein